MGKITVLSPTFIRAWSNHMVVRRMIVRLTSSDYMQPRVMDFPGFFRECRKKISNEGIQGGAFSEKRFQC